MDTMLCLFWCLLDVQVPLGDATQIEMDAPAAAGEEAIASDPPAQLLDVLQLGQNPSGRAVF